MRSTVAPLEGNKVKVTVEVDEPEFDRAVDAAFRKIAREVRIPGFRPGKAPRRLLEARLGTGPAREQALRDAIPNYLAQAVREHEVDVIAPPEVDITAGGDAGPIAFDATVQVRPTVTVPGYGGLRVEVPSPEPTDAEIDERVDAQLRPAGELVDVDRPAADGDFVTVDLSATRTTDEGEEPVPGLNTEDWLYEVGRGWVSPEFDEHLRGASTGDTVVFTAAPSGTTGEAEFTVEVKKVQSLVLPELTDEWVQENLDDLDTVEAWRAQLRGELRDRQASAVRQQFVDRAVTALAGLVDEDPPEALVNAELQERARGLVGRLQQQGISLEQFLGATGQDPNSFTEMLRGEAANAVKVDLALRAVADAEGLTATDEDLEAEYRRIATSVDDKPDRVRSAYERNDAVGGLRAELRKRAALEWLLDHVEVVDPEGKPIDRGILGDGHDHDHGDHAHHDHGPHDHGDGGHDAEGQPPTDPSAGELIDEEVP